MTARDIDLDRKLAHEPLNDLGNARRLIGRHGDDLVAVDHIGWHVWDGKRFEREAGAAEAMKRCFGTVDDMAYEIAGALTDPDMKKFVEEEDELFDDNIDQAGAKVKKRRTRGEALADRLRKFRVQAGNAGKIKGMLTLAEPLKRMPAAKLDARKLSFTVGNGVLVLNPEAPAEPGAEIETHRLAEFDRADLGTKLGGVIYDPAATCPKFLRFLESIMPAPEVRGFLQRFFGYCLTGDTSEQVFLVFYGKGANGKSQLLIAIRMVMGDYASTSDIKTFLADDKSNGANARPDIARLPGNRLVVASEPEQGMALDESTIKTVTGGEMMVTRNLFRDMFEFEPAFKIILSTNYKIRIRGTDNGIWRRVLLVPFEQTIAEADMVKDMGKMLGSEEGPGILNWMLDGYADWRANGLAVPAEIRDATDEYRSESDPIGIFMRECIELTTSENCNISAARVWNVYTEWCRDGGFDPFKRNGFGRQLTNRGVHRDKSSNAIYRGIRFTEEAHALEAQIEKRLPQKRFDEPNDGGADDPL